MSSADGCSPNKRYLLNASSVILCWWWQWEGFCCWSTGCPSNTTAFYRLCCPPDPGKKLVGEPFAPVLAIPFDLFPHTVHCELVLLFSRWQGGRYASSESLESNLLTSLRLEWMYLCFKFIFIQLSRNYFLLALELPNFSVLHGSTWISGVKRLSVAFHQPSLPFKPFWDAD